MRRALSLFGAVLVLLPSGLDAQTQRDLNERGGAALHRADSTLNAVYAQLVATYRSDTVALRKLRATQHAWLVFRDAQVEATYPAVERQKAYGSVLPMCISGLLEELTKARVAQLRRSLRPQEGDVCSS